MCTNGWDFLCTYVILTYTVQIYIYNSCFSSELSHTCINSVREINVQKNFQFTSLHALLPFLKRIIIISRSSEFALSHHLFSSYFLLHEANSTWNGHNKEPKMIFSWKETPPFASSFLFKTHKCNTSNFKMKLFFLSIYTYTSVSLTSISIDIPNVYIYSSVKLSFLSFSLFSDFFHCVLQYSLHTKCTISVKSHHHHQQTTTDTQNSLPHEVYPSVRTHKIVSERVQCICEFTNESQ